MRLQAHSTLCPVDKTQQEIHPKADVFPLQDSLAQVQRAAGRLKGRARMLLQSP